MNISEKERLVLKSTDVYNACNGEYYKGRTINREYVKVSTQHKLISKEKGLKLVIDKDADDLDMIYNSKGTIIPPDEMLDMLKPDHLKIPIKTRQEVDLPDSDLLKTIHYYVSRRLTKNGQRKYIGSMDETSLLAMGILVESWVDQLLDKKTCKLFLKEPEEQEEEQEKEQEGEQEKEEEQEEE